MLTGSQAMYNAKAAFNSQLGSEMCYVFVSEQCLLVPTHILARIKSHFNVLGPAKELSTDKTHHATLQHKRWFTTQADRVSASQLVITTLINTSSSNSSIPNHVCCTTSCSVRALEVSNKGACQGRVCMWCCCIDGMRRSTAGRQHMLALNIRMPSLGT